MSKKAPSPPARTRERGGPVNPQRADTAHGKFVGGSDRDAWNNFLLSETLFSYWVPREGCTPDEHRRMAEAATIGLAAFQPKNPIEAMMASHAMAQHFATMECARRAMIPDQPFEVAQAYRKASANAARTFNEIVGAMDRHRGKHRQQTVRVERVNVAPGAQAIVGIANAGGRGGDGSAIEGEAHAYGQLEGASGVGVGVPKMRGADPQRQPVPSCSDQG